MNWRSLCFALLVMVGAAGVGCRAPRERGESAEAPKGAAAASAGDRGGARAVGADAEQGREEVVEIATDMLRDLRITTLRIDARSGTEAASLLGELRVDERRYAEVGSPIGARVVRLLAAAGDTVAAGQGLVVLQSVELGKVRGAYLAAAARLELAKRTLERKRSLEAKGIASLREVQEAEAEAASNDAELRSARAGLVALGIRPGTVAAGVSRSADDAHDADDVSGIGDAEPSQLVLRSPVRGVVIDRTVAIGQMVDPAKPAFRVADLTRLWLVVHAFERDAVRIAAGAPARITLPALPGRAFTGRVAFVGREVDSSSRTIPVRIDLDNPNGLLRPGMSASASVPVAHGESTTLVPAAAVQRVRERWCVFVPRGSSRFAIRPIARGRDFGSDVEVLSGLRPGETIIIEGAFLLRAEAEKAKGDSGGEHAR